MTKLLPPKQQEALLHRVLQTVESLNRSRFLHCPTAAPAPNIPLALPQIPIVVRQPLSQHLHRPLLPILPREYLWASLDALGSITRHCINHDFVNLSPTQGSVTHQRVNCDWQTHVHVRGAGEKSRRRLYGRWRVERGRAG